MKAIFAALAALVRKLLGLAKADVQAIEVDAKASAEKGLAIARSIQESANRFVEAMEAEVPKVEHDAVLAARGFVVKKGDAEVRK